MNKHEDCADRCQLQEHKGYDTCQRQGMCNQLGLEDNPMPETDCQIHGKLGSKDGHCPRCSP